MLQNYFLKENWCELQWSSVLLVWLASDPHIWLEPCCMIHFALFSFQRTPAGFHLLALTWVSFYILLHPAVFVKHFFEALFKSCPASFSKKSLLDVWRCVHQRLVLYYTLSSLMSTLFQEKITESERSQFPILPVFQTHRQWVPSEM